MNIEKVKIEDAKELLAIYAPYVEKTAVSFEYDVPSILEFEERIIKISSKFPYIKAVENGEIIGYAYANTFKPRKAYDFSVETTIYIKKDNRKSGVGKALYSALEDSLKKMGIQSMNACITYPNVSDEYSSTDSFVFHSKIGFSVVGRFTEIGYKFGKWYDMIWMQKSIGDRKNIPEKVEFGKWDVNK